MVSRNIKVYRNSTDQRKIKQNYLRDIIKKSHPDHHYLKHSKTNRYLQKHERSKNFLSKQSISLETTIKKQRNKQKIRVVNGRTGVPKKTLLGGNQNNSQRAFTVQQKENDKSSKKEQKSKTVKLIIHRLTRRKAQQDDHQKLEEHKHMSTKSSLKLQKSEIKIFS